MYKLGHHNSRYHKDIVGSIEFQIFTRNNATEPNRPWVIFEIPGAIAGLSSFREKPAIAKDSLVPT
jgi:hypothetical protein